MKTASHNSPPKGFALIATISILVLLALISVGLLGLSTLTVRTAGQSEAQAEAQANARLGMMITLGELQKSLGPDQRVTARSEILTANPSYPLLTGAFKTVRDNTPNDPAGYFKKLRDEAMTDAVWLVSSRQKVANPSTDTPSGLNSGKLAKMQIAYNQSGHEFFVQAGKIPVTGSNSSQANGSYAWWVDDESQKAKINIAEPENLASGQAFKDRWKTSPSQQSNFYRMDTDPSDANYSPTTISNYDPKDKAEIDKLITLSQADIPYDIASIPAGTYQFTIKR